MTVTTSTGDPRGRGTTRRLGILPAGMGGVVVGILVWREGGESVGALLRVGPVGLGGLAYWLVRRKREDKPALIDPDLFKSPLYRLGISGQTCEQIALGGMMIGSRRLIR